MKLWKIPLRHYRKNPWQLLFAITGVALGVAVVVAIDLANNSALKALELSNTLLTGDATHRIIAGPKGIDETLYKTLRVDLHLTRIAPRVTGYGNLLARNGLAARTFQLVGIDVLAEPSLRHYFDVDRAHYDLTQFLSQPNTCIMLASSARQLGLVPGSEFSFSVGGVKRNITLAGTLDDSGAIDANTFGSVLFVDIATAQELLNMNGRLSQIDLALPEANRAQLIETINNHLPVDASIVNADSQGYSLSQMTRAFQLNLTALSLLALIVGIFLIYNTMTFSVVQRRTVFSHLRTLGMTRRSLFLHILSEAFIIAVIATALGILLGISLGANLLEHVTKTINDLYYVLNIRELHISTWSIVKGSLIGVIATLTAVIIPAIEATKVNPQTSNTRQAEELRHKKTITRLALSGLVCGGAGFGLLVMPTHNLTLSFIGLFIIVVGFAMLIPYVTSYIIHLLIPLIRATAGNIGVIGLRGIATSFSRTGIAVTSLAIAIATSVGIGIMIDSFRLSVVKWLDQSLHADIIITPLGTNSGSTVGSLSSQWLDTFTTLPQARAITLQRNVIIQTPNGSTRLNVIQIPRTQLNSYQFINVNRETLNQEFFQQDKVVVSESYAFRNYIKPGDNIPLMTDNGIVYFGVAGIYIDYGSERGVITMSRTTYLRHWNDHSISSLGIFSRPGTDIISLKQHLRELIEQAMQDANKNGQQLQDLSIRTNAEIQRHAIAVFDHTFAVTRVLRLLAIAIAFIGILSALMAIHIERGREMALLRAIGVTPRQVWFITGTETGLIGILVGVFALCLGIAIAMVLVLVINRRSFGWSMEVTIEPSILVQSLLIAIVAALLAGAYPSFRLSRTSPANALREE